MTKYTCTKCGYNEKGQIQIKIETLVPDNPGSHIKTRFFHSIWIPKKNIFEHIDGAIKEYEPAEYHERYKTALLKAEKASTYTKIFRYNGEVRPEIWFVLSEAFFYPEPLLQELFNKI